MKPAPLSARNLKALSIASPLVALTALGALMGGCQALDNPTGANKQQYDVRDLKQEPAPRLVDVPKPLPSEDQARLLLEQGLTEQALQAFEKAIAENPLAVTAFVSAGDIYYSKGDIVTAQKRFEAAALVDPSDFGANYKNGLMLHLSRRVGEAVAAYLKALRINPYDFNANLNTGTAFLQLKEPQQALTFAEKAVELDKQSAKARANLGAVFAELGRHADAVAQYRVAAQLEELSPPLLLNLANSLGKMDPPQYGQMLNTLDELLRRDPTPIAHERRAYALFKLGRRDESLSACRAALSLDANHYPALNILGVIRLNDWLSGEKDPANQKGDEAALQEALASFRRSLKIEGNQIRIKELLGMYQSN